MAPPQLVFVEVGAAQRPVVRDPGRNRVIGASDGPAVPEADLLDRLPAGRLIGRKKLVGNPLVEKEHEVEPAPAEIEATRTARPTRPVDDARQPSVPPDDVARPVITVGEHLRRPESL